MGAESLIYLKNRFHHTKKLINENIFLKKKTYKPFILSLSKNYSLDPNILKSELKVT